MLTEVTRTQVLRTSLFSTQNLPEKEASLLTFEVCASLDPQGLSRKEDDDKEPWES